MDRGRSCAPKPARALSRRRGGEELPIHFKGNAVVCLPEYLEFDLSLNSEQIIFALPGEIGAQICAELRQQPGMRFYIVLEYPTA